MEVTIVGLQNAGKTSLLRVLAVSGGNPFTLSSRKAVIIVLHHVANLFPRVTSSQLSKNGFRTGLEDRSTDLTPAPSQQLLSTKRRLKKAMSLSSGEPRYFATKDQRRSDKCVAGISVVNHGFDQCGRDTVEASTLLCELPLYWFRVSLTVQALSLMQRTRRRCRSQRKNCTPF